MQKKIVLQLFVLVALSMSTVVAQDSSIELVDGLKPVEFMVGEWSARYSGQSEEATESVVYKIVLNGNAIEASHYYKGAFAGTAFYCYDQPGEVIRFWYFTTGDGYGEGTVRPAESGLLLNAYMRGGAIAATKGEMKPIDENSFEAAGHYFVGGKWVAGPKAIYTRMQD